MRKLIILNGLSRSRKSKILNRLEIFLKMFELKVWIIPRIKKFKKCQVFVLSFDYEITRFLKTVGVNVIEFDNNKFNTNEIESIFKKSTELFEKLYQYTDSKTDVNFLGANISIVFQEDFTNLFFDKIKILKHVQALIKNICPTSIYVDDSSSSLSQIVMSVAESDQIQVFQILPRSYTKSKNLITDFLIYKRYQIPSIHANTLNLMSFKDGKGKYTIFAYMPYVNFIDSIHPLIKAFPEIMYKNIYALGAKKEILSFSEDYTDMSVKLKSADVSKETAKIKNHYIQMSKDTKFCNNFEYNGINFWSSTKKEFGSIMHNRLYSIMRNLKECNAILDNIKPDLLLVGDDRTTHVRTCVLLAKNKKIPVIEIQHGVYSHFQPKVTPISDKVCVWGNYQRSVLRKAGGTDNQIRVTGCPKFDSLSDIKRNRISQSNMKKNILFATQHTYEDITPIVIEKIIRLLHREKEIYLIIKPHPAEKSEIYRRFSKKCRKVIVKNSSANIDDVFLDVDVLITISSTVGINGAILDVPMIQLNFDNAPSLYTSISLEVRSMEEIIPAIRQMLYDKELLQRLTDARKKFVYEHAFLQDGKASERVVDTILQTLQESKNEKE